jgi:outer membrane protein assembly factor BamE (lipoprotein component of BamABCDE complex)
LWTGASGGANALKRDQTLRLDQTAGLAPTRRAFGALALAALALGGCDTLSTQEGTGIRGFVLDEKALDQIKPGSSAEQVVLVLGTPSTTSTVGGKAYYYISQKISQPALFMEEKITDQRVVAIYLDKKNKVERVANYGLKDGVVFDFISRTTPTGGADSGVIASLFRRIGQAAV